MKYAKINSWKNPNKRAVLNRCSTCVVYTTATKKYKMYHSISVTKTQHRCGSQIIIASYYPINNCTIFIWCTLFWIVSTSLTPGVHRTDLLFSCCLPGFRHRCLSLPTLVCSAEQWCFRGWSSLECSGSRDSGSAPSWPGTWWRLTARQGLANSRSWICQTPSGERENCMITK